MTLDIYADLFDDDLDRVAYALDDARVKALGGASITSCVVSCQNRSLDLGKPRNPNDPGALDQRYRWDLNSLLPQAASQDRRDSVSSSGVVDPSSISTALLVCCHGVVTGLIIRARRAGAESDPPARPFDHA